MNHIKTDKQRIHRSTSGIRLKAACMAAVMVLSFTIPCSRTYATTIINDDSINDDTSQGGGSGAITVVDGQQFDFEGWNDDTKEDAWTTYSMTDWVQYEDRLVLESFQNSASATGVSSKVADLEENVKAVLKNCSYIHGTHSSESYTALILAMIEVLSDGNPSADDPCCIKKYFNGHLQNMTFAGSVKFLYTRLVSSENAHNTAFEDDEDKADIYNNDDILKAVIQGAIYGDGYSKKYKEYTKENSLNYIQKHQDILSSRGISSIPATFGEMVSSFYSATNVSGSFNGQYIWPCECTYITSGFGYRPDYGVGNTTNHKGIDVGCSSGSAVWAMAAGTVTTVEYNSARGNYVVIDHGNGNETLYQHLSSALVSVGQTVAQGETIALSGSTGIATGPHLHFEIHINGEVVNPLDYVSNE